MELAYPYLYLDASYFKVNWGGRVEDLALLVAMGVNEEGYRGHGRSPHILLLAVEPAGGERREAWRNLLKGLLERGLHGVGVVAEDLQEVFVVKRRGIWPGGSWSDRFKRARAVEVFAQGLAAFRAGGAFPGGEAEDQGGGGVSERGESSQPGHGGGTQGHGGLGVQALHGHGPALGRGRETHKNRDLTQAPGTS